MALTDYILPAAAAAGAYLLFFKDDAGAAPAPGPGPMVPVPVPAPGGPAMPVPAPEPAQPGITPEQGCSLLRQAREDLQNAFNAKAAELGTTSGEDFVRVQQEMASLQWEINSANDAMRAAGCRL